MPYNPTTWVEGVTPLGPTNLNKLEQGVAAARALAETKAGVDQANVFSQPQTFQGGITDGNANTDVSLLQALGLPVDTRSWTATTWTADKKPTHIDVKDGATTVATIDVTYNADSKPTSVVVVAGGKTITYTISWTGEQFNGYTKAVV